MGSGGVVWITGLSGAGKSTLASVVASRLKLEGRSVVLFDGDELREVFGAVANSSKNHDRNGRLSLAMQYSHLCRIVSTQGVIVVIATISLFKEVHSWNRENLPRYFEVYLNVPLIELRRRDPKGIYSRFDSGELKNVAGLDLSIDEPIHADCVMDFSLEKTVEKLADELLMKFKNGDYNNEN